MAYQPQLGLSWKYNNTSGLLSIVATVRMNLAAGEIMAVSTSAIFRDASIINVNVTGGNPNSPLDVPIEYTNIGKSLTTESVVRSTIALLPAITVRLLVNQGGSLKSEVIGVTSQNSEINIL